MAKKPKLHINKSNSVFLCCFGCSSSNDQTPNIMDSPESDHHDPKPRKKTRWFSWRRRIRNAKSSTKTVPLDTSLSDHHQVGPIKMKSKPKSQKASLIILNSQTPETNLQEPPCHTPPPTRQRHKLNTNDPHNPSHRPHDVAASPEDNTRQQSTILPLPTTSKRLVRRPSSKRPDLKTTSNQPIVHWQNANKRSSYDPVLGMSMVVVTLVIMIVWGRLCAILCTSAWLYFIPRRFSKTTSTAEENDDVNTKNSRKELDYLDSEVYKKRVVLEGFLERNHR